MHSDADIAPLFATAVCVNGNFISQTFMGATCG